MILTRNGSQPSLKGPDDWFIGVVRIDPIHLKAQEPSRLTSALVTFEPGARTNWHTHPLGQLLIVTSGKGWTQCEGEPRVEINAGDTIWCPPGHKHWHGATNPSPMSNTATDMSRQRCPKSSSNGRNIRGSRIGEVTWNSDLHQAS